MLPNHNKNFGWRLLLPIISGQWPIVSYRYTGRSKILFSAPLAHGPQEKKEAGTRETNQDLEVNPAVKTLGMKN